MFVTILLLSLSLTVITSLNTCENCIPASQCPSLLQLISRNKSKKTLEIIRKEVCGFDLRQPKVCCDTFDNQETENGTLTNEITNHRNVHLLPTDCGQIKYSRLLGGYVVWDNEFPWVVRIAYKNDVDRTFSFECMGTLINSRYVLTSADCVMNRRIAGVRIGGRTQRLDCADSICERDIQDIGVSEQISHPEYTINSRTLNNIALLRLRNPVDLSKESAGVICLPLLEEHRERNITENMGTVSYWDENERETQFKIPASISTNERCALYTNKHINDKTGLLNNSICAQRIGTKHCETIPGSPLILEGSYPDSYKYLLYGILITEKPECGPEIYTDVRKYMKWISDTIRS